MAVDPIPKDHSRVSPYLTVRGVASLLEFVKHVFDAQEVHSMQGQDGTIVHAEVTIGGEAVMMGEAHGDWQPTPGSIYIYVEDADATYQRAMDAGATSLMEPADQFHGDRYGGVKDPCGNQWWIATHIEDVPPDELERRNEEYMRQNQQQ